MNYFRYKQFNKDVITVAVGYYLRYTLSYRDISEILRTWCKRSSFNGLPLGSKYAILYQIWKKSIKAYYKWRIDETYIKIKGKWSYLYRAIDAEGHTLDIWLRKQQIIIQHMRLSNVSLNNLVNLKGNYRSGTFNEGSNG